MADDVPRVLAGRYEVGELIGRGGMAEVHIGRDTRLNRTVAMKVLRSDFLADPSFQARFRREAQSAASLNHPAIVSVYDTGEEVSTSADGTRQHWPFIVMEYVEGHTVRDLLRDGSALPIDEAIEITLGVLTALEYSHHSGIVHRDIKPANVMLTPTGAVKVMDFGIARALTDTSATMTQTQAVVGTAQYLSPEQARGEVVDARSDLYSTGCLLFELLTGRPPFVGDTAVAVAYQHVGEQPQPPSAYAPDIPEQLDRILLKALAKDTEQRYSSAAAFRADLEAAAAGGVVQAPAVAAATATQVMNHNTGPAQSLFPPTSPSESDSVEEEKGSGKRRALIWTLVALAVIVAAVIAFFMLKEPPPDPEPETVPVPELTTEMDQGEVKAVLNDVGLELDNQGDEPSDSVDVGNATQWEPEVGSSLEKGESVQVWFSSGPESLTVPDVSGMDQDDARDTLSAEGFDATQFSTETEDIPKAEAGEVDRTDPAAGKDVEPDTAIALYVASGNVDVPDVLDEDYEDAQDTLDDLGLRVNTVFRSSEDEEPGTVIDQDVTGLRPVNSSVTITVAEEPQTPTEEPSEDPSSDDPSEDPSDDPSDDPSQDPSDDPSEDED